MRFGWPRMRPGEVPREEGARASATPPEPGARAAATIDGDAPFRRLFEHTSDLACVIDGAGRVVAANPAWRHALGAGEGPIEDWLAPSAREAFRAACGAASGAGDPVPLGLTLHARNGLPIGVQGQLFPCATPTGAAGVCALFRDLTLRASGETRLAQAALRDPLTNLANAASFAQHLPLALARARRQGTLVGVVLIDLDHFHDLNEQHGHTGGDRVLITVADRLTRCVRTEDVLARLEADRFALALERLHSAADAAFVLERVLATLTTPLLLPSDEEVRPQASIGVALGTGVDAGPDDLLRAAEAALLRAREGGGEQIAYAPTPIAGARP